MGERAKISIANALREEKRKEIIALHKTRPEYFIYMDMRTESEPVTPKVSIPSKMKWEKEFYLWRNAINKYHEGCEYVDWIEVQYPLLKKKWCSINSIIWCSAIWCSTNSISESLDSVAARGTMNVAVTMCWPRKLGCHVMWWAWGCGLSLTALTNSFSNALITAFDSQSGRKKRVFDIWDMLI